MPRTPLWMAVLNTGMEDGWWLPCELGLGCSVWALQCCLMGAAGMYLDGTSLRQRDLQGTELTGPCSSYEKELQPSSHCQCPRRLSGAPTHGGIWCS